VISQEDKCYNHKRPLFLLLSLRFYCWAWCHMVWNIPLVSLGGLSWLCILPNSCPPPALLIGSQGAGRLRDRKSWCCARTVQQQPKHCCIINTILTTNTKHSTTLAVVQKLIPSQPDSVQSGLPMCLLAYIFRWVKSDRTPQCQTLSSQFFFLLFQKMKNYFHRKYCLKRWQIEVLLMKIFRVKVKRNDTKIVFK